MIVKVVEWLRANLASILGIAQAVVKLLKELLTAIVNILFPLFPDNGSFEKTVLVVRGWVEKIDAILEKIKLWLLSFII
jgi:hypothetical protein